MIGEEWFDLLPHVEDSIRSGELMIKHPRTAGFHVGDAVRIISEDFAGQIGELKVIDMYQAGDYFGVYLDSTQTIVHFCADEIEKVGK